MKILYVSNSVKIYNQGFRNDFYPLLELGHEIVWAANFNGFIGDKSEIPARLEQIDIQSYPFHKSNLRALKRIKQLLKEEEFHVVVCTTPIGGALARMAAKKAKDKKVIYLAHGFLFFKGAPLINRTVYKWQEELMSRWTDAIVTITDEDFEAAKKFKLRQKDNVFLVHGAGVDTAVKLNATREEKRKELNLDEDNFVIASAGVLNKNKNNIAVIKAINELRNKKIKYLICGEGDEKKRMLDYVKDNGLEEQIIFLGFRTDIQDIFNACDLFAMPSFREGVPRSLLEAMNLGKPCIGADTRGIRELIGVENTDCLCNPYNYKEFVTAIDKIMNDKQRAEELGERNKGEVYKYTSDQVKSELLEMYKKTL